MSGVACPRLLPSMADYDTARAKTQKSTPVLNPEGKIQNFIAIKRDITERKRTEERLKELSLRLSYHVDNSPLAVIEWGADMRLTRWSGAAERMFGWKAEEVLGKRMEDFRWIYKEDERQVAEVSGLESSQVREALFEQPLQSL